MSKSNNDIDQLIKALIANPDSPAGLGIQSAINKSITPRVKLTDSLTDALVDFEDNPSDDNRVAVTNAIEAWLEGTGLDKIPEDTLASLEENAREIILSRKRRPPEIETIMAFDTKVIDHEYHIAGTLGGIKGIWHRLWSSISTHHAWKELDPDNAHHYETTTALLKAELEEAIGRSMTETEYTALDKHALNHANTQVIPALKQKFEP